MWEEPHHSDDDELHKATHPEHEGEWDDEQEK